MERTIEPLMDVSVASSFGSPIMFNPKRGIEASAGVLKDILLGNSDTNDESFQSNADFEDLDHIAWTKRPTNVRQRMSRSAYPTNSNLDLRRVGLQMSRPHSHSPARGPPPGPSRRYSPPQGSTGSGTKSPETTPKTSWEHGQPLSTSSPRLRRHFRAPYYVADTVQDTNGGHPSFYLDSSSGSSGVFPSFPMRHHHHHHHHHLQQPPPPTSAFRHHFDMSMASHSGNGSNGMYDESMYRLLPMTEAPTCWSSTAPPPLTASETAAGVASPASSSTCFGMSDEELQREYAVVLDALRHQCHLSVPHNVDAGFGHHFEQIAAESPRIQSCGSDFHYYTNWGQTSGPCCHSGLQSNSLVLETCVDDEEVEEQAVHCEDNESCEEMVSSWTGISGVPGLGYSIPPKEGCDFSEACKANVSKSADPDWSANSAQNLASLKVDLPRVHHHHPLYQPHHHEVRSRTASTNLPPRLMTSSSAVNHLMSDPNYFEEKRKPLRATVSSRLRNKLSLPPSWSSGSENKGPSSLPSHFIPRAPIPTPEVLANKKKLQRLQQQSTNKDFSANNEAILRQEDLYQSPKERDGDYSYAYDCSISPAVVIKWNEENEDDEESESETEKKTSKSKKDNENIYEEIEDVGLRRTTDHHSSGSSSVNNSDSGIGGAVMANFTSSSSGASASKGTLDVSRPRKKAASKKIPLSSLDALISQTSPDLTPHQRLNLRKSLVDELFEELIQRHHKRVLEELRLDVEEFIAPKEELGTPKSSRSSQSGSKLIRCESMDFKDQVNGKKSSSSASNNDKKIGSKFWQGAKKCSEVFQKKLKKTSEKQQPTPQQPSQVTRSGHRPLSAIVTTAAKKGAPNVIVPIDDALEDDSDNEQEAAARRLLRSQIIKSFWEQHDNNSNDFDDDIIDDIDDERKDTEDDDER